MTATARYPMQMRFRKEAKEALEALSARLGKSQNETGELAVLVLAGLAEPDAGTPLGARLEALRAKLRRTDAATPAPLDALIRRAEQAEAEAEHLRDRLALVDAAVHA